MSLFNTYLESAKTDDDAQKYYDLAADHLFAALQTKDKEQIRLDNQLWLGNHYYQKISKMDPEYDSEPLTSPDLILLANQAAWVYDRALSRSIQFNKDNVSLNFNTLS